MKELIAKCVIDGVRFSGLAGATYSVQDLFHDVSIGALRKMGQQLEKAQASKSGSRFVKTEETAADRYLSLQVDTLLAVIEHKEAEAKKAAEAAKAKEERAEKKATLQKIIAEKELSDLGSKDLADLKKMLEDLA